MTFRKSVALGVMFPAARHSYADMADALSFLKGKVGCVEFYYEGEDRPGVAALLKQNGLAGIFIAVIPQKEQKADLCALDVDARRIAVEKLCGWIDQAAQLGCESVMICSGRIPEDTGGNIIRAEGYFVESTLAAMAHARDKGYNLNFLLEPCDSAIDARHLIGPTQRAVRLVGKVREADPRLMLTMDAAHLQEEGEDIMQALRLAKPFCNHIHFANCITRDTTHPLYGDKHLSFDWPGGELDFAELTALYADIKVLYGDEKITLALETLCREDDAKAHFTRMTKGLPFWEAEGTV